MDYIDAKHIVMNHKKRNRDYLDYEYIMNIYRGCTHGCIYCYLRSDYYDKIGEFDGNFDCIRAKKNALQIIRDDLLRKAKPGVVCTGGMSDPYNPVEKKAQLTRNALELLNAFGFGICVITKSDLVVRDTDILSDIKEQAPASVNFSITGSDDELCHKLEPSVSTTSERFKAVAQLTRQGIPTGVLLDPLLPYITDTAENVQEIVKKASYYGADYIYMSTRVTMATGQREYFYQETEKHFPGIADKYKARYKQYYNCRSPHSKKLWNVFAQACEKEGISYDMRAVGQRLRRGYPNFHEVP